MSNTNTGGPAFPGVKWVHQGENVNPDGMTLRDYFAAGALQGWLATYRNDVIVQDVTPTGIADFAYEMADAMLVKRVAK